MTVGQLWRARRDAVIRAAWQTGRFSQDVLADVFDLPQSRVSAIVRKKGLTVGNGLPRLPDRFRGARGLKK